MKQVSAKNLDLTELLKETVEDKTNENRVFKLEKIISQDEYKIISYCKYGIGRVKKKVVSLDELIQMLFG
jgi:hypothetical protein